LSLLATYGLGNRFPYNNVNRLEVACCRYVACVGKRESEQDLSVRSVVQRSMIPRNPGRRRVGLAFCLDLDYVYI
jgi:hypothetical protein